MDTLNLLRDYDLNPDPIILLNATDSLMNDVRRDYIEAVQFIYNYANEGLIPYYMQIIENARNVDPDFINNYNELFTIAEIDDPDKIFDEIIKVTLEYYYDSCVIERIDTLQIGYDVYKSILNDDVNVSGTLTHEELYEILSKLCKTDNYYVLVCYFYKYIDPNLYLIDPFLLNQLMDNFIIDNPLEQNEKDWRIARLLIDYGVDLKPYLQYIQEGAEEEDDEEKGEAEDNIISKINDNSRLIHHYHNSNCTFLR